MQLEVVGPALAQFYCHCDDCQAMHGAAYVTESIYPAARVRVTRGQPTQWVLRRNPRFACPTCATRLFVDVLAFEVRGVNGYLLPPGELSPSFHMHCRFALLPVRDGLPHYAGLPERFGGTNETVDW